MCAAKSEQSSVIRIVLLNSDKSQPGKVVAQCSVSGNVSRLLAAQGRIVAVTLEGQIHTLALDDNKFAAKQFLQPRQELAVQVPDALAKLVNEVNQRVPAEGFAVMLGADDRTVW